MQWIRVVVANVLWFCYSTLRARRWKHATRDVAGAQHHVLRRILACNADCAFGQEHEFATLQSVEAYQQRVALRSYEAFEPYIQCIAEGQPAILTTEPVQQFGLTSGSTQASKLIPYTRALVNEFQEGIDPWVHYLFCSFPRLVFGKTYWSVTPVGERKSHTTGGVPIGFDDEQAYFSPLTRWVLSSLLVAPSQLAQLGDIETFRYITLRLLLQEKPLSWISVWNPSFFTLLLEPLRTWLPSLTEDIRQGTLAGEEQIDTPLRSAIRSCCRRRPTRANELQQLSARWQSRPFTELDRAGRTFYEAVWPNLCLVSCWAHGNATCALPQVRTYFPHATIHPKGLLATEAFVSFPWQGEASALSLLSHFFEFEEVHTDPSPLKLAHELQQGRIYSVIVTTSGGLYRYRLNDLIEVVGFYRQCPLIRFKGRQAKVVDLCGEKLNEEYVHAAVMSVLEKCAFQTVFWMVAPEWTQEERPHYTLFLQIDAQTQIDTQILEDVVGEIEEALQASYHYEYARRLGQLARCRLFVIDSASDASHTYLSVCTRLGQRLGDVKPTALHPYQGWSRQFAGQFI